MKLQIALDLENIRSAKNIIADLKDIVDIVEIGTPLIIKEGVKVIRIIRKEFPFLTILADLKIIDGGKYESKLAFEAGADIVTVLGIANNATIKVAIVESKKYKKHVMVDMMRVKNIEQRVLEIKKLGVKYICIHTPVDIQSSGDNPLIELKRVKSVLNDVKIAVAGGINLHTIKDIVRENPEIIIVGSGITKQKNKRKTALQIKEIINNYERM